MPVFADTYKGLYVDNFFTILGNRDAEDKLLKYAASNGFNTLSLYELHKVQVKYDLTGARSSSILADFVTKAKTEYGIRHITAVAENYDFFADVISRYNRNHPAEARFDVYSLEFEFWVDNAVNGLSHHCTDYLKPNGYTCDVKGAFTFYQKQLSLIDALAKQDSCLSETYVGILTAEQAERILPHVDRILLSAYVADPAILYPYMKEKFQAFASTKRHADVVIIFEADKKYLGKWLRAHKESQVYATFKKASIADDPHKYDKVNVIGYQWFAYTMMK